MLCNAGAMKMNPFILACSSLVFLVPAVSCDDKDTTSDIANIPFSTNFPADGEYQPIPNNTNDTHVETIIRNSSFADGMLEDDDKPAILGGRPLSSVNAQPFYPSPLARIVRKQSSVDCTGVLISTNYVLTAASCVTKKLFLGKFAIKTDVDVVLGDYSKSQNEGKEQTIRGKGVCHPSYPSIGSDASSQYDPADIAVVRLSTPAVLNDYVSRVSPAQINGDASQPAAREVVLFSWGAFSTSSSNSNSDVYRLASGSITSASDCSDLRDFSKQICVRTQIGGVGFAPCTGDAGAPLASVTGTLAPDALFGIASFPDQRTCSVEQNFVVIRTSAYYSWIQQYL